MSKKTTRSKKKVIVNVDEQGLTEIQTQGFEKYGSKNWPVFTSYTALPNPDCRTRIVVAVAETLTYEVNGVPTKYKMETGRQMAQACHAVSGLKLLYSIWQSQNGFSGRAYSINDFLTKTGITTICLKARDSEELQHILHLAENKGLLHFAFADDNAQVYGTPSSILSAVAIGPVEPEDLYGITDYLPLWQDPT